MPEHNHEKRPEHEDLLKHTDTVVLDREHDGGVEPQPGHAPDKQPSDASTS